MVATQPKTRQQARERRHRRVRQTVFGTAERPRLSVFRSHKHIYAQVVRDDTGETIVAASSLDPELRGQLDRTGTVETARAVGKLLGQRAVAAGLGQVVFDRGGYLYHGRVRAIAEGAREAGLEF